MADQDSGKKGVVTEAKGHGKWKDGRKNADAEQYYGKKPPGIKFTKYCTHFYSADGCQRGAFFTFAYSAEDIGTEWFDRRSGAMRPMVLCKFFRQGIGL